MSLSHFISLGLLQGLTEFLPISSSGHLWLLQYAFGMTSDLSLEILLHVASVLAVIVCLRQQIWQHLTKPNKESWQLLWATLLTIPTALVLDHYVLVNLSLELVAWSLILTGMLIWLSTVINGEQDEALTWKKATLVGLVQGLSVLPGISRSGITIVALLMLGVKRKKAAEFSFLLSIPTILGALVFSITKVESLAFITQPYFFIAALVCFVAAMFSIRFMLKTISHWWGLWSIYCIGIGVLLLLFSLKT